MNPLNIAVNIYLTEYDALDESLKKLADASREAKELSYSPYSKFRVGAAVLMDSDKIVQAANQENAAYPVCLCAERNVLAAASSGYYHGQKINAMAICVDTDEPASPCGACRQSLVEYEFRMKQPFDYLLLGNEKIYYFRGIENLMPLAFDVKNLV